MKTVLGIALLSVLVACSEPHDPTGGGKLAIAKHENGRTASRGYMLNDHIKVGDWVYFFEDGKKEKQGSYSEGQMQGTWTYSNRFGEKDRECTYKNGEVEGLWTAWNILHHKGEGTYKNGKKEGDWTFWWSGGQKKEEEGTYKNGKKEGVWTFWGSNSNVAHTQTYKNGELVKWR